MENKELIEKLEKMGKVKDVSEAFLEYPVEEEWHKGDVNSFVKEDIENENIKFKIGMVEESVVKEYMKNLKKLF